MKYNPCNNRIIVKDLKSSFEKTAAGIYLDQEDLKVESKNNLIRAVIVSVGVNCTFFKPSQVGLVVLIHEVGGVPMHGIDPSYKILREDDIWAWTSEPAEESINLIDAYRDSEISQEIGKADAK